MIRNSLSRGAALGLAVTLLAACGGGSSPGFENEPPVAGALKQVSGAAELEASLKAGLTAIRTPAEDTLGLDSGTAGSPAASGDFTGTYTQEADVDEFDAVRYDGERLFVAPRRFLPCCYFAADGAESTGTPAGDSIRILATDPGNATASPAGSIPLADDVSVQGMYVEGDRLFALTATLVYGTYGDFFTSFAIWAPEELGFLVYDVGDPGQPAKVTEVAIDGVFVDSRRVGDVVFIVSRYTPAIDGLIYDVTTAADQAHNQALLDAVSLDDLLPRVRIDGVEQALVDPASCYVTAGDPDGYPVITTVTAVPVSNPAGMRSTCYNEDAYGVYVSGEAVYLTELRTNAGSGDSETRIHKFAFAGTSLGYRGSADVAGQVWRGGQADFRMSEFEGDLRVVASSYDFGSGDFVDHKLYVLREAGSLPVLDVIGELPNSRRPEEIGKPNEALYGVRFLGDRAYAVTFEQIDPLYVIDLADPRDPRIAGELTVPGFSDFLHPVTDDLLLGLGTPAGGGVKLELFDVSDIARPLSRGATLLGGPGSFSEASWDRHAFTYQPDVGAVDRLAVPVVVRTRDAGGESWTPGLHLFEVRDKTLPERASLLPVGALEPPVDAGAQLFGDRHRAFLHDDAVFYVVNEAVWAAPWFAPTLLNGPF